MYSLFTIIMPMIYLYAFTAPMSSIFVLMSLDY